MCVSFYRISARDLSSRNMAISPPHSIWVPVCYWAAIWNLSALSPPLYSAPPRSKATFPLTHHICWAKCSKFAKKLMATQGRGCLDRWESAAKWGWAAVWCGLSIVLIFVVFEGSSWEVSGSGCWEEELGGYPLCVWIIRSTRFLSICSHFSL